MHKYLKLVYYGLTLIVAIAVYWLSFPTEPTFLKHAAAIIITTAAANIYMGAVFAVEYCFEYRRRQRLFPTN